MVFALLPPHLYVSAQVLIIDFELIPTKGEKDLFNVGLCILPEVLKSPLTCRYCRYMTHSELLIKQDGAANEFCYRSLKSDRRIVRDRTVASLYFASCHKTSPLSEARDRAVDRAGPGGPQQGGLLGSLRPMTTRFLFCLPQPQPVGPDCPNTVVSLQPSWFQTSLLVLLQGFFQLLPHIMVHLTLGPEPAGPVDTAGGSTLSNSVLHRDCNVQPLH